MTEYQALNQMQIMAHPIPGAAGRGKKTGMEDHPAVGGLRAGYKRD